MSSWRQFDRETLEERDEREDVLARIAAAEKVALAACATIRDIAEEHPTYAGNACTHALTHIATMATIEGKTVFKRADQRTVFRK